MSSLVDISKDSLLREIKRFNSYRTTEIYANYNPDKQKIIDVYNIINKKFKKPDPKFSGIKLNVGGSAEFSADMMNELKGSFAISLVAVFMILVFMFKSLLQPFIVALAIPFGIIGVIFSFTLHGMPLSFMGVMGVIGLSGVVVNDSIVMVDFINRERKENPHWSIADCVKNGAVLRLRPIILTSVTTVAGLLPTAYGIGGSDAMILPTAISLSWGLMFSTMFVLLFLPVFYLVIDDIKNMKIPFLTSSKNISGRHNHTSEIFSEAVIIDESHNLHYEIFTQEKEKLSPKRKAKSKR